MDSQLIADVFVQLLSATPKRIKWHLRCLLLKFSQAC